MSENGVRVVSTNPVVSSRNRHLLDTISRCWHVRGTASRTGSRTSGGVGTHLDGEVVKTRAKAKHNNVSEKVTVDVLSRWILDYGIVKTERATVTNLVWHYFRKFWPQKLVEKRPTIDPFGLQDWNCISANHRRLWSTTFRSTTRGVGLQGLTSFLYQDGTKIEKVGLYRTCRPGTKTGTINVTINVKVNSEDDTFSAIGCSGLQYLALVVFFNTSSGIGIYCCFLRIKKGGSGRR